MSNNSAFNAFITWILLCSFVVPSECHKSFGAAIRQQKNCRPPDVPLGGSYRKKSEYFNQEPKRKPDSRSTDKPSAARVQYDIGDKVEYFCQEDYLLSGANIISCRSSGTWNNLTPFCDKPTLSWTIGCSNRTLYSPVTVPLKEKAIIKAVRISFNRAIPIDSVIEVSYKTDKPANHYPANDRNSFRNRGSFGNISNNCKLEGKNCNVNDKEEVKISEEICGMIKDANDQEITVYCESRKTKTDGIIITDKSSKPSRSICKVQVYTEIENGCKLPPNFTVTNGHFKVSRSRAELICNEGYTAENTRMVCEENEWKEFDPRCVEILCTSFVGNRSQASTGEWFLMDEVKQINAGTKMQLKCPSGYRITGYPDTIECHKDGKWTKTTATCAEEGNPKKRVIIIASVVSAVVVVLLVLMGLAIFFIYKQKTREVVVVFKPTGDGSTTVSSELEYNTGCYESIHAPPVPPSSARPSIASPSLSHGYMTPPDLRSGKTPADIAFGTLKSSTIYGS